MSTRLNRWRKDMKTRKGSRQGFKFWLNWDKADEAELIETIALLMDESKFSDVMRKALRIIPMLMAGSLNELFAEFPWVRAEFLEYMRELQPASPTETDKAEPTSSQDQPDRARGLQTPDIEAEQAWLEAEQERIEQERAWEQRRIEDAQKALEAEKQAIEQERKRIEAERQQSQSAMQKQLDRLEELLLQQGNIPIQANGSGNGLQPITLDKPRNPSGPKTLNVPKFSTPTFDDEEEDTLLEVKRDEAAGDIAVQNFLKSAMGLQDNFQQ